MPNFNATRVSPDATQELPDWVEHTPEQSEYYEFAMVLDGDHVQNFDLTREEYISLKHKLAMLRGYLTEEEAGKSEQAKAQQQDTETELPQSKLLDKISKFDADQLGYLSALAEVVEAFRSNAVTPAENLIVRLGKRYSRARANGENLTPEDIEWEIREEFTFWYESAIAIGRKFRSEYAHQLNEKD